MHENEKPVPKGDIFIARQLENGHGVLEMDDGAELFRSEESVVAFFYAECLNRLWRHALLANPQ